MTTFHEFLQARCTGPGFTTEDVLASFLPLVRQVLAAHEAGQVAPLEGLAALRVEGVRIWYEESQQRDPRNALSLVRRMLKPRTTAIEIVNESRVTHDVDAGVDGVESTLVAERDADVTRPVWMPGYVSWEHQVGHHDPLTDVFSLGLILASLACSLDLTEPEEHARFVEHRSNLFSINPDLHPVLAKAITGMTELDRHERPQELRHLLPALENYRDQEIDFDTDLARSRSFAGEDRRGKRQIILRKLQERLFEISRRNRLLHFRQTMQTVNLTQSSIPLMFDVRNVRENQILTWNHSFRRDVLSQKAVSLNKYLNFREAIYLPGTLDRVRAEARRDENEYGFAQLRLIVCFLRWADLKAKPAEQYESPLLLLPVKLTVRKGIRDRYSLTALDTRAEVNPVVRHLFKQLYEINLPETVELDGDHLDQFYKELHDTIEASDPAVTLTKVDRPRIDLIHEKARRRLDQYRRQARLSGRGIRHFLDLEYSYDPANYHPLGIRLFEELVRPARTHLESVISSQPPKAQYALENEELPPTVEAEKEFYQLRERKDANPFNWEFDQCSVTLANLKYRRMSLVRDYTELLEQTTSNAAFEATFSITPRDLADENIEPLGLSERYHVVPCDPTQTSAIAHARRGDSYIIQGPPGTGKSQTITNLIADYVVRGKRVLFVCEKRAAIDVVYHRLKQQGLHELCCLIHDSQADKKEFVMDLKATYETFLAESGNGRNRHSRRRQRLIRSLERELLPLQTFDSAMQDSPERAGTKVRSLLNRLIHLRNELPDLSPGEQERIPFYAEWRRQATTLREFSDALREVQPDGILAHHPLRLLKGHVAQVDRPLEFISQCLKSGVPLLDRIESALESVDAPVNPDQPLQQLKELVEYSRQTSFLAQTGLIGLLNEESELASRFRNAITIVEDCNKEVATKREINSAWIEKLSAQDVTIALEQAQLLEGRLSSVFKPSWWRLRSVLHRSYNFASHSVRPSWSRILADLNEEYQAIEKRKETVDRLRDEFGIGGPFGKFCSEYQTVRDSSHTLPPYLLKYHQFVAVSAHGDRAVLALDAICDDLDRLTGTLDLFLDSYDQRSVSDLKRDLLEIDDAFDELPDYLDCLTSLTDISSPLAETLRTFPLPLSAIEAAAVQRSLDDAYRGDRALARFDGALRQRQVSRLRQVYDEWQKVNAATVRERVRQAFIENVNTSSKPAAQLSNEQKQFKKLYNRGRREIEHEFGKSMRYKSIRDLVADESGLVVRDLKPVWLMSPLSVSDTLPLNAESFDVVVFDEASQITLEEAVPAIFRAPQSVVVGDEMQLPPTNFFMARRSADDDELTFEEAGDLVQYDLDSNSFLNHAARNLPSRMLGWHYRSRSESLISFSNHAFYDGRLLTVPEEGLPDERRKELVVESADDASQYADSLLDRAVSFHFMSNGVYEKRRNTPEADYVAHLVRRILEKDEGHSVGIVAFSEAQQSEIESALQRLAADDKLFAERLEAELEREDDGQFVGLLVKNLENIQGDERDVIIMSVCYGPDSQGKTRMNFGPVNLTGGEKRLNVAFSRAKHHMALVSSMRSSAITNDFNDGAHCLKNYLRYAEASSVGNLDAASLVLRSLSNRDEQPATRRPADALVQQLSAELERRGYQVDLGVGQSDFRCDLAVAREGERTYGLGILVDTLEWYSQRDLLERELMRPRLLEAFGWRVYVVLACDWYRNRQEILKNIEQLLDSHEHVELQSDDDWTLDLETDEVESDLETSPPEAGVEDGAGQVGESFEVQASVAHEEAAWSAYLELVHGRSAKFWEITVNGSDQTLRFGRIGSRGQTRSKSFTDHATALSDAQRQRDRKLGKGYGIKRS